jgi:hypothetical protein
MFVSFFNLKKALKQLGYKKYPSFFNQNVIIYVVFKLTITGESNPGRSSLHLRSPGADDRAGVDLRKRLPEVRRVTNSDRKSGRVRVRTRKKSGRTDGPIFGR